MGIHVATTIATNHAILFRTHGRSGFYYQNQHWMALAILVALVMVVQWVLLYIWIEEGEPQKWESLLMFFVPLWCIPQLAIVVWRRISERLNA